MAFPLISAGVYGYPKDQALKIAADEINAFLKIHNDLEIMLVLFDREAIEISKNIF